MSAGQEGNIGGVELAPGIRVPESVIDYSYSSASGPGGQNVNKRASKCTLKINIDSIAMPGWARAQLLTLAGRLLSADGELTIQADEHRSQGQNRDATMERLRALLVQALTRPKIRRKTKPSRGSKERRLEGKKARSEIKEGRRRQD